jgi:hypothetical protein
MRANAAKGDKNATQLEKKQQNRDGTITIPECFRGQANLSSYIICISRSKIYFVLCAASDLWPFETRRKGCRELKM